MVDFQGFVVQAVEVGNNAHVFKPVGGDMTEHLPKFRAACLTAAIYLLATLAVPTHGLAAQQPERAVEALQRMLEAPDPRSETAEAA